MVCIKCENNLENFHISMLSSDSEFQKCSACNDLKNFIKNFHPHSHQIYNLELRRKFCSIFPLYTENEIIMIKPEIFDIKGFDEDKILKDIFESMDILDTSYSSHNEINLICDKIMAQLIHQLNDYLTRNPMGYLVAIMSSLEYNFHVTGACVLWTSNNTSEEFIDNVSDDFTNVMLRSLSLQKKFDFGGIYKSMYKEWESRLSIDKYALQYGIELIHNLSKKLHSQNEPFNPYIFGNIFSLIRAIYKLIYDRETTIENIKNHHVLSINKEGYMQSSYNISHENFANLYFESIENKIGRGLSTDAKERFNEKCKKFLGVTLDELGDAPLKIFSLFKHGDDFLIGNKDYFEMFFMTVFDCSIKEASKIFNYLSNNGEGFEYASSTKTRKNKFLNHCLLELEEGIFICQVQFLSFSLNTLYLDVIDNNLTDGDFKRELFQATHVSLNIEFENKIATMLNDEFPGSVIKSSIPKDKGIPKLDSRDFISFHGEIDILFFYSGKLFLIECKNKSLKTNVKALSNDLNSFKKMGLKSFQYKIDQKINEVYQNWDSVLAYLEVPNHQSIPPMRPIGVFVTYSLTLATFEENLPYPVVPSSHLKKWINETINL